MGFIKLLTFQDFIFKKNDDGRTQIILTTI